MKRSLLLALCLAAACTACSSTRHSGAVAPTSLFAFSERLSEQVQKVLPSVVEIVSEVDYDIFEYLYAVDENGQLIADDNSPFGARMVHADLSRSMTRTRDQIRTYGAGLVIGENPTDYLILTSRHIVTHTDTITEKFHARELQRDLPFYRAIARRHRLAARGATYTLHEAKLIADDRRIDIALVSVPRHQFTARVFEYAVTPTIKPMWGQLTLLVGYPDEIKQVSLGLTGESPYPGNFSVSAYGNFGYSGGPVFIFDANDRLVLAGISRSLAAASVRYVEPDSTMMVGRWLRDRDVDHLRIGQLRLVNPSRMHAVQMERIITFLRQQRSQLLFQRFRLAPNLSRLVGE